MEAVDQTRRVVVRCPGCSLFVLGTGRDNHGRRLAVAAGRVFGGSDLCGKAMPEVRGTRGSQLTRAAREHTSSSATSSWPRPGERQRPALLRLAGPRLSGLVLPFIAQSQVSGIGGGAPVGCSVRVRAAVALSLSGRRADQDVWHDSRRLDLDGLEPLALDRLVRRELRQSSWRGRGPVGRFRCARRGLCCAVT
jgi:hypothetical protein